MCPNFQNTKDGQGFLPGRYLAAALLLTCATCATAKEIPRQCFDDAGKRFNLPRPDILRALAQQESSSACIARHSVNSNGTYDIGCMGINSSWLPMLHRQFGITEQDLLEPCTNVHVGAWIFAKNVRRFGDTWQAVGAYNAASESKRMEYAWKIYRHLNAAR
ncbi:lytic transglycosylase domain-containing protein [Duganella sp. FT27W]|uniref:lytic transglycosylase domain-containing protein n=1 Tax=Duganella sp. FT27W TaxID=2654636 RepID=UPI00128B0C9E|nr:lytic transglycosylase domain-containing protein [Duganella sp. FT27W]MPQ55141.1 transglycosylase SLT domain-containing protein [Duganella sp. FT27W]